MSPCDGEKRRVVVCVSLDVGQSHFPEEAAQAAPYPSKTPSGSVLSGNRSLKNWSMTSSVLLVVAEGVLACSGGSGSIGPAPCAHSGGPLIQRPLCLACSPELSAQVPGGLAMSRPVQCGPHGFCLEGPGTQWAPPARSQGIRFSCASYSKPTTQESNEESAGTGR